MDSKADLSVFPGYKTQIGISKCWQAYAALSYNLSEERLTLSIAHREHRKLSWESVRLQGPGFDPHPGRGVHI